MHEGGIYITATGGPHSDLVLPTTKHERVLGSSTLSYKKCRQQSPPAGRRTGPFEAKGDQSKTSEDEWTEYLHGNCLKPFDMKACLIYSLFSPGHEPMLHAFLKNVFPPIGYRVWAQFVFSYVIETKTSCHVGYI